MHVRGAMSDSEEEGGERQVKVVLLGGTQAGKTAITQRYSTNNFSKQYQPTTGFEFYLKRTTLGGSKDLAFKLLDISGSSLSERMLDKYVYGAQAILLVYDVTSSASFESLAGEC